MFVEDQNKNQERATYEDVAIIREELQRYATHNSLRDLRREVVPEVMIMKNKISEFGEDNT